MYLAHSITRCMEEQYLHKTIARRTRWNLQFNIQDTAILQGKKSEQMRLISNALGQVLNKRDSK